MRNGSAKAAGSPARERRKDLRAPARIEVRFREASQAALAFRAYSLNFSVGGLCLRTRTGAERGPDRGRGGGLPGLDLDLDDGGEPLLGQGGGLLRWALDGALPGCTRSCGG